MNNKLSSVDELTAMSKRELAARLLEAEMALEAIRSGEVDAFIVSGAGGEQIYTLKDADHPYRLIVEEMNEGAITLDDGAILYSNQCFARMLHYPLEKMMGSSLQDYLLPSERNRFKELLNQAKTDKPARGEFLLVVGDSPSVQVQIAANRFSFDGFSGFCLIITDVTEVKRKEQALEKWSKIFEHAQWGIAIIASDGITFEMMTPAFTRMYGFTANELLMKPAFNLLSSQSRKEVENNIKSAQEKGRHVFESVHRRKDGTDFPVEIDLTAIKDAEDVLYYVLNVRDISELKKTLALNNEINERKKREEILSQSEQQLKILSSQLEHSNKHLEQFAYVAAHDIKSPLKIIKSCSELLQKKYNNPEAAKLNKTILESAKDLDSLTTALLEYAKVQQVKKEFESVDCQNVLQKVLSALAVDIKECGAKVTSTSLGTVRGDKTLIHQLFQNLISNAIKFRSKEDLCIDISSLSSGKECQFAVKDNGIGIHPEEQEKIFEVFHRAGTHIEGTGIGLATCKKIVEIHGGRIWVESKPGQGAIFYFTLPASE